MLMKAGGLCPLFHFSVQGGFDDFRYNGCIPQGNRYNT